MIRPQFTLDLHDELIVDNFAGGGGASTGIELALGRCADIAVNHDPQALAMHEANHPQTLHLREDVFTVDPVAVTQGRKVGLAWFSPDCTHFSKAKGGKPRKKTIRGLAWVMVKWAAKVRPRVCILENVEEFKTWGPLLDTGHPCPRRKGNTFRNFVARLRNLGYAVEWRELRASEYGAPTIRKRLFLIARCDGRPIVWPERADWNPRAKKPGSKLKQHRTAAECIDWSLPCPSIFETRAEIWAKHGLRANRPLAPATERRIARGLKKFVLDAKQPFIVPLTHQGSDRVESVAEPMRTVTGAHRGERALVTPYLANCANSKTTGRGPNTWPVEEPVRTITAGGGAALVSPYLTKFRTGSTGSPVTDPVPTITAGGKCERPAGAAHALGLVVPYLTEHANASTQRVFAADEPLRTACAAVKGGHFALVAASLVETAHGEESAKGKRRGKGAQALDQPLNTVQAGGKNHALVTANLLVNTTGHPGAPVSEPAPTVTTGGHHALVTGFLAKHFSGDQVHAAPLDAPAPTVTSRDHNSLVTAHLTREFGNSVGAPVAEPAPTVMPRGQGKTGLVAAHLSKFYGTTTGQPAGEPLHTITGHCAGGHHALVQAFLMKYYSEGGQDQSLHDPMHTLTTKERMAVVTVAGVDYQIDDIGMRMLKARELFRAQGFPDSYIIDPLFDGKPLSETAQVRMCGNSVPPPFAAALAHANVPELAAWFQKERAA